MLFLYISRKYKQYVYGSYIVIFINVIAFFVWWQNLFLYIACICIIYAKACNSIAFYTMFRIEESVEQIIEASLFFLLFIALFIHLSL